MRKLLVVLTVLFLTACDGDGGTTPPVGSVCTAAQEKQAVLENMLAWYLWNRDLPADVNINDYATADDLLDYLVTFRPATDSQGNPIPRFSFIDTIEADQQFFDEGQYEGYGFRTNSGFPARPDFLQMQQVFVDSPAYRAGLRRGQRIVTVNGIDTAIITVDEWNAALDTGTINVTMRELDNTEFTVQIVADIVTIDPMPQGGFLIDRPGNTPVGYIELVTFISTAEAPLADAFALFRANNVTDVIIDLRYNGGGLVRIANLLGNLLGGDVAQGLVFSNTEYNPDRAPANNRTTLFQRLANSINLSNLVVIATQGTASASELVTNGLEPHVNVGIVGDRTFGKPVGQVGLDFCDKRLRPTSFKTTNADGFGDYFGGLPADCVVADDLTIPIGDATDPRVMAALEWLETGACPVVALPDGELKATEAGAEFVAPEYGYRPDFRGRPEREYVNAY